MWNLVWQESKVQLVLSGATLKIKLTICDSMKSYRQFFVNSWVKLFYSNFLCIKTQWNFEKWLSLGLSLVGNSFKKSERMNYATAHLKGNNEQKNHIYTLYSLVLHLASFSFSLFYILFACHVLPQEYDIIACESMCIAFDTKWVHGTEEKKKKNK